MNKKRKKRNNLKSRFVYPASGLQQDINEFIAEFTEIGSFRFSEFAAIWRSRRFIEVIQGRHTQSALEDFYNCLFYLLVSIAQPPSPRLRQVCAIFMLYAFYFKQPIDNMIRIRLNASQWQSLSDLTDFLISGGHLDVLMILSRLNERGAFHCCATVQPYFPNVPLVHCATGELTSLLSESDKDISVPQSIEELSQVHGVYCELKRHLVQSGHAHSLDIVPTDSVDQLKMLLSNPESSSSQPPIENSGITKHDDDREDSSSSSKDKGVLFAERRQKLKASAFDNFASTSVTGSRHSSRVSIDIEPKIEPPIKKSKPSNTSKILSPKKSKGAPRFPRKRRSDWHGSDSE